MFAVVFTLSFLGYMRNFPRWKHIHRNEVDQNMISTCNQFLYAKYTYCDFFCSSVNVFFYHENCPNINILILFFTFTPTAVALMNSLWFQLSFILFTSILSFSLLHIFLCFYAYIRV